MAKRVSPIIPLLILMAFGSPSAGVQKTVDAAPLFDLTLFLPPPPARNSSVTRAEIAEILVYQKTRTPDMVSSAEADAEVTVFRFADVLGPEFTPEKLPLTAAFFERVLQAENALVEPAKIAYGRPRPYQVDPSVNPCVPKPGNLSYPSGHAACGTTMAVLLAHMVPEKKGTLLARGRSFSENRIVGGVHYRSDVEAGEIAGALLAAELLKDPRYKDDYESSRRELRDLLDLK